MLKKSLIGFGLGSVLALTLVFANDKAQPSSRPAAEKEAQKAAIAVEGSAGTSGGSAYDCQKAETHCLRKSGAAKAAPSREQNMASSGSDCPRSADCPKADCDKSQCLKKKSGHTHADPSHEAKDAHPAETEI